MSWLLAAQSRDSHSADDQTTEASDHDHQAGCYLTDGANLYGSLGLLTLGPPQMVGLEDCRSLDVILISADELHARRPRRVFPASAGSERTT